MKIWWKQTNKQANKFRPKSPVRDCNGIYPNQGKKEVIKKLVNPCSNTSGALHLHAFLFQAIRTDLRFALTMLNLNFKVTHSP